MSEPLTTDPSKPAQRMRAGSMTSPLIPWIAAAILLLVLPYIFTANSAITIMNQMAITIIFALAYNMLLGQGGMLSFGHAVYMPGSAVRLHAHHEYGRRFLPMCLCRSCRFSAV